ncbi:MAG: hypothetical protein H0T95_03655 [Chthoniobacterales bacterium]|nr:hypothetical protein [Chthoniobacterales bacterium]
MSDKDEKKEHKQETQAIADQPQEEFISPENIPSRSETPLPDPPAEETGGGRQ